MLNCDLKISIITPNYNYSQYIGETIESIVNQDYDNIENIIVDDGSTDNSISIIKKYEIKYPNKIKLIQQENKGQSVAINNGLKHANGEIIGWINSDDLYKTGIFSRINSYFISHPNTDAIYSDLLIINNASKIIGRKKYLEFDLLSGCILGFGNLIANNTLFFRRKTFEKVGFLNESLKYVMDAEIYFRLGKIAKIDHINDYFAYFRHHSAAKSSINKYNFKEEEVPLLKEYFRFHPFSRFIPYRLVFALRIYYRCKRIFLRFIFGHYF